MNIMRLTALLFICFTVSAVAIDFKDELVDWSLIAISSAGAYTFSQTGPFFDEAFVDRMKRIIHEDLAMSAEIDLRRWRERPARQRLLENFFHLLAPIL